MKLIAGILITIALIIGALSAATAYNPQLESIDGADGLTLNAPAGKVPDTDPAEPVLPSETVLTTENIEKLREAGVTRVRVKEFAFSRWDARWQFLVACMLLLAGAAMIRQAVRSQMASAGAERPPTETPDYALEAARDEVQRLIDLRADARDDAARAHHIAEVLDRVRTTHQEAVVAARLEVTARLGLGGYAQLMDRFASAERQLHRGWSAAVDGALEEAEICLVNAVEWLDATIERLRQPS